jgi:hypothetical protein
VRSHRISTHAFRDKKGPGAFHRWGGEAPVGEPLEVRGFAYFSRA